MAIVAATAAQGEHNAIVQPLAHEGIAARTAASWEDLCAALCDPATRLVLVDPELPGLKPTLLDTLAGSLAHRPKVRVVGASADPLHRIPATPRALVRQARAVLGHGGVTAQDRRDLRHAGLGEDPVARLTTLAATGDPILLLGERGTGKEPIARILHRIAWASRVVGPDSRPGGPPFVGLPVGSRWERTPGPGTLYLEAVHRRDPAEVRATVRDALALRWRVCAGTRAAESPPGVHWAPLHLPPLRLRPNDLDALAQAYFDRHTARLGVGRRRLHRSLLAMLHTWRWPGNGRELEDFVVATLTETTAPTLRADDLSPALHARLRPPIDAAAASVGGYEEMAEEKLRPVVTSFTPGSEPSLHRLVTDATERALLTLVLARTGGNRKAAAELLGVSRNTLLSRIRDLRISASKE